MRSIVVVCLFATTIAWAQTPATTRLRVPQAPAKQLLVVGADGQVSKAPSQVKLRLLTEEITQVEKISDVLRRNGLYEDERTLDMLKRLNPANDLSSGNVTVGTRLNIFVPKFDSNGTTPDSARARVTFDSPMVAKWAVQEQVAEAAANKVMADRLSSKFFESPPTKLAYRQAMLDIDTAAKVLNANADSLSAADLAVARYQMHFASRRAAKVNKVALETGMISAKDVDAVKVAALSTQPMIQRLQSGQTPLPLRQVKVSVQKQGTEEDVKGLQVYVLPSGIVDYPEDFSDDDVQTYLTRFSFLDETSPSNGNIAVFDTRIWVGPKLKFREMVQLVKNKKLNRDKPINDPDLTKQRVDLVFVAPNDVVEP